MSEGVSRAELVAKAKKMKKPRPKFVFGKHNGKSLDWVAEHDPQYIDWVFNNVSSSYWPVGLRSVHETLILEDSGDYDMEEAQELYEIFHD